MNWASRSRRRAISPTWRLDRPHRGLFVVLALSLMAILGLLAARWAGDVRPGLVGRAEERLSPRAARPEAPLQGTTSAAEGGRIALGPAAEVADAGADAHDQLLVVGTVEDERGLPVPDVPVRLQVDPLGLDQTRSSDASGSFRAALGPVRPGSLLRLRAESAAGDPAVLGETIQVQFSPGEAVHVRMLRGTALVEVRGHVRFEDGTPAEAALIRCAGTSVAATADAAGAFRISAPVFASTVQLAFAASGVSQETHVRLDCPGPALELGRLEPVELVLRRPTNACVLRVVDEQQQPVAGARVSLGAPGSALVTDADGECHVAWADAPRPGVRIEAPGFCPTTLSLEASAETRRIVATLHRRLELAGQVLDESADPVGGARIEVHPEASLLADVVRLRADEQGRFVLPVCRDANAWRVLARTEDGRSGQAMYLAGVTTERLTVIVRPRAVLSGAVVDEQGAPVAGALVVGLREDIGEVRVLSADTDARGEFALPVSPGGSYRVAAQREGFARLEVIVGAGERAVLTLARAGCVSGRVLRAGRPFRGTYSVSVHAQDEQGRLRQVASGRTFCQQDEFQVGVADLRIGQECVLVVDGAEVGRHEIRASVKAAPDFALVIDG